MSHSDLTDLAAIRAQVEARQAQEREHLGEPQEKPRTTGGPDDPRFLQDCLDNNERGDGVLYASLHRGKFVCNKSKKDKPWMMWAGHHWVNDHLDESVRGVEAVALRYLGMAVTIQDEIKELRSQLKAVESKMATDKTAEEADSASEAQAKQLNAQIGQLVERRKAIKRRVDRLRSWPGANKCLNWAHCIENPLAIVGDEIDRKPWLLACPNGVVDLRTGNLHQGKPDDYLVRAVSVPFPTGQEVEHYLATGEGLGGKRWQQFINEIHQDDQERIDFVHRLLGYSITGLRTEHFIACFLGEGANGKGTMFETLHDVLGDLAWSIEPEMILEQKNAKSTAGPSPDIISLHGRRLVVASETEAGRRVSAAKVKRLTGGDTLTGRAPHDKYEINFKPTHKLVLYTNHPPRGLASDFAMFRRLLYIWYPLRYVDNPADHQEKDPQNAEIYRQKDPGLPDALREEAPWILAWLVRGCLLWQAEGGLNPPQQLRAAAEAVRNEEDTLQRFLDAICTQAGKDSWVAFKEFYEAFKKWYEENVDESERFRPSKKLISDQLKRKGFKIPTARETSGQVRVYGLELPVFYQ